MSRRRYHRRARVPQPQRSITATQLDTHDLDWARAEAQRRQWTISHLLRHIVREHRAGQTASEARDR